MLTLIPCVFMLVLTLWAMVANELNFVGAKERNWVLIVVNAVTLLLAVALIAEALMALLKPRRPAAAAAGE